MLAHDSSVVLCMLCCRYRAPCIRFPPNSILIRKKKWVNKYYLILFRFDLKNRISMRVNWYTIQCCIFLHIAFGFQSKYECYTIWLSDMRSIVQIYSVLYINLCSEKLNELIINFMVFNWFIYCILFEICGFQRLFAAISSQCFDNFAVFGFFLAFLWISDVFLAFFHFPCIFCYFLGVSLVFETFPLIFLAVFGRFLTLS